MAGFPNSQSNPAAAIPVWNAPIQGQVLTVISTSTNTLIKTGSGVFAGLSVNTGQSGATMTVYDGTSASGKLLGTFSLAAQSVMSLPGGGYGYSTGLFVVTAGLTAGNVTVVSL